MPIVTDRQLDMIMATAEPLPPADRGLFLAEVAALLEGQTIGNGAVHRACCQAWQKFWTPPDLAGTAGTTKYSLPAGHTGRRG